MNDTLRTPTRPEVEAFVAEVRDHLADLTDDEREELLGGLEADLSDQLADGADVAHVLGDPATYAAELRAAAGLPEHAAARGRRRWLPPARGSAALNDDLDDLRSWFFRSVDRHSWTRQAWALLVALRPAWWVLRAWLAVTFVDQQVGRWEYVTLVPTLGAPYLGPAVLLAAIVVSTLIGTGRLWPGSGPDRPLLAQLLLAAANVAVLLLGLTFAVPGPSDGSGDGWMSYEAGYRDGSNTPGLQVDGETVRNVFAYDREGRLLEGVQLFRGNGEPLAVRPGDAQLGSGAERTVGCGWFNGTTQLFNVFPLAQREQRRGSCLENAERRDAGQVGSPQAPFAVVPPVVSPVPAPVEPAPPAEPSGPARPDADAKPGR